MNKLEEIKEDVLSFIGLGMAVIISLIIVYFLLYKPLEDCRKNRMAGLCHERWYADINWGSDVFLSTDYDVARKLAPGSILYSTEDCF